MTMLSRSGLLALAALASLIPACYSPSIDDGRLACSPTSSCPDNYQCASNGFCFQNGAAVPPDAPTAVTAVAGVRSATVSWTAPANTGGSAITSYTVTALPGGLTQSTQSGTVTTLTFSGLADSTAYTFTVASTNAVGVGLTSAASTPVTTFSLPGAPTMVVASAAGVALTASLDWTAPADAGGTPVTGYLVEESLNGGEYTHISPAFTGTHATISGLSAGGSYAFVVAAVNAVGAGTFSAPSAALVLAAVPSTPVITVPAVVTAGLVGVTASVPANAGDTYAWTVTGATLTNPAGAAGQFSGGTNSITFTVTAPVGGQVSLSCVATNSVGSSAAATASALVTGVPMQPSIITAPAVTLGDTGITAKVVANPGMTYSWMLSANATLRGSDLHGVTAMGFNTITYDLNATAVANDHVQLSVVEVNPSQMSSAPGTAEQLIAAQPAPPTITTAAMVVLNETGIGASVPARPNMTYAWTLSGGALFADGSTTSSGSTAGGVNSILFNVSGAAGGTVGLQVVETNAAGISGAPSTATVPVGALPSPLNIGVALDNGASSPTFQSGANQYVTVGATAVQAQVASIPGATYAWSIVSGGAIAHAGETGTAHTFLFDVTGASGTPIQLACVASIGSSSVMASQSLSIVAAPVQPAVSLDGSGATLNLLVGDVGTHHAAVTAPVATSTYAWSASPSADVASLGQSGSTVPFVLAATAPAGDAVTISAVETNAAGRAGTAGTAAVILNAPVTRPVITVSSAAVAPGAHYTASFGVAQPGVTYTWSIAEVLNGSTGLGVACPSSGANACSINPDGSLSFTADSTLPTDGSAALELQLVAKDAAGQIQTASPIDLPVIALPTATISFGTSPTADAFGANITAGGTRSAFLAPTDATSVSWSISPGAIVGASNGLGVVFNASTAAAGATLVLSVTVTNAVGSATANANVHVVALPSAPSVAVAAAVTDPANAPYNTRQYTATLTPGAVAGTSYRWMVTGGGSCTDNGLLCGIAQAAGQDATTGTFKYTVTAVPSTTLSFTAVALDAAGDASPSSAAATEVVVSAPQAPTLVDAFKTPGDPTSSSYIAFAPGKTYDLSIAAEHGGMVYRWTIGAETCPGAGCADISAGGDGSSIALVIGTGITGTAQSPAVGSQVSVSVAEVDAAGDSAPVLAPLLVDVIAAPAKPVIGVLDHHSVVLTAATDFITEHQKAEAYVDSVVGQAKSELNQTYQWTATSSAGGSILDATSTAAGTAGTDPSTLAGSPSVATDFVTIDAPAYAVNLKANLSVIAINGAAETASDPLALTVEPAPVAPVLDVPKLDADVRTPKSLTYGAAKVQAKFTPALNASGVAMATVCSTDANATIDSQPVAGALTFDVKTAPTLLSGAAISTVLTCVQTNAAGDAATGTITLPLSPALTVTLTPADGTSSVAATVIPSATFSYAPDASTVTGATGAGCTGNVTLVGSDGSCVALTIAVDPGNAARFTFTPAAELTSGLSYTLTISGANSATGKGVADLQGVILPLTTTAHFNVPAIPQVTLSGTPTERLQSIAVAWTNPSDAQLDHIHIVAHAIDQSGAPDVVFDTLGNAASSATLTGLRPMVDYTVSLQVAESTDDSRLGAAVTTAGIVTAFTGDPSDFTLAQRLSGLGPNFDGSASATFSLTWDAANLYFGFTQSDAAAKALRNDGDALWVAVDTDGAAADTHGESFTLTGGSSSYTTDRIIWPFSADYVLELKNSGGQLVANLRTVATTSWAQLAAPVDFNGATSELELPGVDFAPVGSSGTLPTQLRMAFAFLATPSGGSGKVIDLAPASNTGGSTSTVDGHVPATDVLGALASITNGIDLHGLVFTFGQGVSLGNVHKVPAPALVTFNVDTTAANFAATDSVQLFGSIPPLSYTLTDSSYALADDGSRGSNLSTGHYAGVFNFGLATAPSAGNLQELFFKVAHNGAAELSSGGDRVWTLSGATETVGNGTDPIVFNTAYGLTHSFVLNFAVANVPNNPASVVILGDQPEIGTWNSPFDGSGNRLAGAALAFSTGSTWTGAVTFTNHDFVSGNGSCPGNQGTPDAAGCPLSWKAVEYAGQTNYENGNNHSMNDDVLNKRSISYGWSDSSNF